MMGWEPDLEFLQALKPKQKDTVILEKIGKAIRRLISVNQGSSHNSIQFENISRDKLKDIIINNKQKQNSCNKCQITLPFKYN